MGDLPSTSPANNAPPLGSGAPAGPTERSRPEGRLPVEGGAVRTVVVGEQPSSLFRSKVPPVPRPQGIDMKKVGAFLECYPTRSKFEEAFPAMNDIDLPRSGDTGPFIIAVLVRGESAGNKTAYENLLVEYGVKNLIVAIRELRSRPEEAPTRASTRTMPDLEGDKFAIKAWQDNFNSSRLESCRKQTDVALATAKIGDRDLAEMLAGMTRTDEAFQKELTSRTLSFVVRLPEGNSFFKVNDTRAQYFRNLFTAEFADRFLQELPEKFKTDQPTQSKLEELGTSVGEALFAEILLSQMRMEVAGPDFDSYPAFSRIMIRGLKTLYETGDVEKARAAGEREASACWNGARPRYDQPSQENTPMEKQAYLLLAHAKTEHGRFGRFAQLQPPEVRPFVEDMVYYYFVSKGLVMATPSTILADIYDCARSAPFI